MPVRPTLTNTEPEPTKLQLCNQHIEASYYLAMTFLLRYKFNAATQICKSQVYIGSSPVKEVDFIYFVTLHSCSYYGRVRIRNGLGYSKPASVFTYMKISEVRTEK